MLVEPDGSTRIVEYYADSVNGFNANVRTIDKPIYYGGAGIDDDLMMMDQQQKLLLEKQKLEFAVAQKLELEQLEEQLELQQQQMGIQQQLEFQQQIGMQQKLLMAQKQQMETQVKPELLGATGFSYSNQVVHH